MGLQRLESLLRARVGHDISLIFGQEVTRFESEPISLASGFEGSNLEDCIIPCCKGSEMLESIGTHILSEFTRCLAFCSGISS